MSETWQFDATETGDWREADSPVDKTLYDVTPTRYGPVAVGGSGLVVARSMDDGEWGVLFDAGPDAENHVLRTTAATADGDRIWFAGKSGSLGFYDLVEGAKYDLSEPEGQTNTWNAMAVAGPRGEEKLLLATTGGDVLLGYVNGVTPTWGQVTSPDGSAAITSATATPDGVGYVTNSNGGVFETTIRDGWRRVGIAGASTVGGVAVQDDALLAVTGSGRAFRYSTENGRWTPYEVGGNSLHGVATRGEAALAVGGSGSVYRSDGFQWTKADSPVGSTLNAVTFGAVDIAVGSGGIIVERPGDSQA